MFNLKHAEELAKKLYAALPPSLQNLEHEIQQEFQAILQSAFAKLDLVTRAEFDTQVKVLARTREKIDALQFQVNAFLAKEKEL